MAVVRMLALIAWTLVVGPMAALEALRWLFSGFQAHGASAVFMLAIGFGPAIFMFRRYRGIKSRWEGSCADMVKTLGRDGGLAHKHIESHTGIAINAKTRFVGLCSNGAWMAYQYSSIRRWETVEAMPGRPAMHTGLFVEVRDVESPRWQIMMSDPNMQARWMEILRQEINESSPEASRVVA